jgi:S-adenosylmethionine hydrolase
VANAVSQDIAIFDITHDIPNFDIWEAAYKLRATAPYWRRGTVFVSVVDPGVGTSRKSVVLLTKNGQYFVSPDNGSLSLVAEELGIEAVREIDERVNRRKGTEESHTFHGRDVYSYTGARLAAGVIRFEEVGPLLERKVLSIEYPESYVRDGIAHSFIAYTDKNFGNVWTDLERETFGELDVRMGDKVLVTIRNGEETVYREEVPFVRTFGEVEPGEPLVFINSRNHVALALRLDDFVKVHRIGSGPEWTAEFRRAGS